MAQRWTASFVARHHPAPGCRRFAELYRQDPEAALQSLPPHPACSFLLALHFDLNEPKLADLRARVLAQDLSGEPPRTRQNRARTGRLGGASKSPANSPPWAAARCALAAARWPPRSRPAV
ncbi:MAG TPA: hypothetical protein VJA16_03100 [Thermoanaerobaculia bacterium]